MSEGWKGNLRFLDVSCPVFQEECPCPDPVGACHSKGQLELCGVEKGALAGRSEQAGAGKDGKTD